MTNTNIVEEQIELQHFWSSGTDRTVTFLDGTNRTATLLLNGTNRTATFFVREQIELQNFHIVLRIKRCSCICSAQKLLRFYLFLNYTR